jgi:hypothetical protein
MMVSVACSSGGGKGTTGGGHPDMAGPMCSPTPEVCDGRDNDCNGKIDDVTPAGGHKAQMVAASVLMPLMRTDYAIDLNGDGKTDNALFALVAILKSQGTNANTQIANGIANGDQILLIDQTSSDATYASDPCATADVFTGVATHSMPDLSGSGHFTIDSTVPSGAFTGNITGSDFESILPTLQTTPVTVTLELVMFPGRTIALPLIGAQIKIARDPSGAVSGAIRGAIKQADVESNILPAFAAEVQEQVMNNPNDPNSISLLGYFDTGGTPDPDMSCKGTCKNPDGSCAVANDGKIDLCEVTSNAAVASVVSPDVQMFSDDGSTYQPNPANTHKDSLSLGIGFTAVGATF